ncbi:MAG: 1-acyl-sn-glycerol-3-phosphate acyltransferase [Acidobacteria bacterium]|nr:1-acyl-sn-glycerol-3-phosphate acyltransferase [Acidobacteriota bacterium]
MPESHRSRTFGKLRYWWCWLAAGSMLLVLGIPSLLFLWLINRKIWLYPLALFGARTWLKACGAKVQVTGLENLDPERSYVFAANHRSYLDTATLFAYAGKRMGLVAKKELLKVPVMGQGMSFVNIIAIDRSNPEKARESMAKARSVMDSGYSFGVFVEGTRALPGQLLPFKKGAFHLAIQTNADIIPVAIKNTDVLMGKRTGVAYPGVIEMVLLPPVPVKERSGAVTPLDLLLETRAAIVEELSKG